MNSQEVPVTAEPMNIWLKIFRVVMVIGILVNLGFIVPALIAPDFLLTTLHLPPNITAFPWVVNAAALLLQVSVFYLPIARDPRRYPVYAWIAVIMRFLLSFTWLILSRHPDGAVFRNFFYTDFAFSVIPAILLQLGLPEEQKFSPSRVWGGTKHFLHRFVASPKAIAITVAVSLLLVVTGFWLWSNLLKTEPDVSYASDEEQFKYAPIGLAFDARIPYWVFQTVPDVCSDMIPGGWESIGMIYEDGKDLPIGLAKREIGFPSVEPNCAFCHTSTAQTSPDSDPLVLLAAPAHELDLERVQRVMYDCASDPRFNVDNVMEKIEAKTDLSAGEKLAYRMVILPFAKQALLAQKREYAWQYSRPEQGPGRTDTFNPTKINVLHMPDDHTIGTVDLPATWNQEPRKEEGLYLHWDGNNNDISERNYAAAMAVGATPESVIPDNFNRVTDFLLDVPPPKFPFPIDQAKAAQGKPVWDANCGSCHDFGTRDVGQVTDISEIGTDRHRLDSFSPELVTLLHEIDDPPFLFNAYRKTDGYSNLPTDGMWARAPYLHNGSVPTLWDLLQAPDQRPDIFYRAYNVYDPVNMGFISQGPEAEKGYRFDTSVPGNGNEGHTYGTELTDDEKMALIEYMKTL